MAFPRSRAAGAALAGVVAAGVAFAAALLAGSLLSARYQPLVALGAVFIDAAPVWLKDFAIAVFGVYDKAALRVGMTVAVVVLAAGAGVLAARWWERGAVFVVILGAAMSAAVVSRAGSSPFDALPSLAGTMAGLVVLRKLLLRLPAETQHGRGLLPTGPPQESRAPEEPAAEHRPAGRAAERPAADGGSASRRGFFRWAGGAAAAAVLAASAGWSLDARRRRAAGARAALTLPAPAVPAPALPPGVQAPVAGLEPFLTPNARFYRIDTALAVPVLEANTWELRVYGLVEQEVVLGFAELLAGPLEESYTTLSCVSNPVGGSLVGTARWLGLPIRTLLARVRPLPAADMVLSRSADGWTASTPLPVLQDSRNALLAVGMNGEPLPVEHGYPVRMVVPGLYGFVSATKWVVALEVTRFADATAYWSTRGWSERGPVKTQSRIEVPRPGARVAAGRVMVGGTAWSPQRGITRVEVQVDDGAWQEAVTAAAVSVDTWRQFSFAWDAAPGRHRLRVRATDAADGVQTGIEADPAPDGASGWHTVSVTVE